MYHRCMRSLVSTSWQVAHRNVTVSIGSSFFFLFVYVWLWSGFWTIWTILGAYVFHFSCSGLFSFLFFSQLPRMFREVRARCHLSLYREAHYNYHTSSGIKIADINSATCTTAYKLLVPLQLSLYTRCLVPPLLEVQ